MSKKTWNLQKLSDIFNDCKKDNRADFEALFKAHPEIQGLGIGVDQKTNSPYLALKLHHDSKAPGEILKSIACALKRKPKDIPTEIGGLPIKTTYRPAARLL